MGKFLLVFVCLLLVFTIRANGSSSQTLENLTAYEKGNAIIDIECEEESEVKADIIEEKWNSGNYEEAIELLKNSPELDDAAIGIQWKEPIKISARWGDDVRVGTRDSILDIDLDVDNTTGNLFAALFYQEGPSNYKFTINMSQDTGRTWAETYEWTASLIHEIDIDAVVFKNHFYLAYTYTNNTEGRIRRFNTSDGSSDDAYGYVTVIDEGVILREITLSSNDDGASIYYLFYFSIMDNDSLKLYYSDTIATNWDDSFDTEVVNANRGLDACHSVTPRIWVSYIGTDDSLYVTGGWSGWINYGPLSYVGSNSAYVTSIGAYGDTVIAVYPNGEEESSYSVRYSITYDDGSGWVMGTILDTSSTNSLVNDVTARNGDGFGVICQTTGGAAEGFYRHRTYASGIWSPEVSFADDVVSQNVKPSIERIADGIYGILYVNHPEQMAWFDRSDWVSGIDEDIPDKNTASLLGITPFVFSNQIDISYYLPSSQNNGNMSLDIFNIAGSHIKTLAEGMPAGSHSVTWFAEGKDGPVPSGIYFCVLKDGEITKSLKMTLIR